MAVSTWSKLCATIVAQVIDPAVPGDPIGFIHNWQEGLGALAGALLGAAAVIFVAVIQIRHARTEARMAREHSEEETRRARSDAVTAAYRERQNAQRERRAIVYRRGRAISIELNLMWRNLQEEFDELESDASAQWMGAPDRTIVLEGLVEHIGDFGDELGIPLVDSISMLAVMRHARARYESELAAPRPPLVRGEADPRLARIVKARGQFRAALGFSIEAMKKACQSLDRDFPPARPIDWDGSGQVIPAASSEPAARPEAPS